MGDNLSTVMILIAVALFFSQIVFYFCEERSLKDKNLSDLKCIATDEVDMGECFSKYNTAFYIGIYFLAVFVFSGAVAYYKFIPEGFGLGEIMAYTFFTSMLGSLVILLVKWRYQPMIKLISSFMYGSFFMAASGIAFALVYMTQS